MNNVAFRFEPIEHVYTDLATGEEIPHITGLLARTGWIDDTWYSEESCERGQQVHSLTAAFDLGGLIDVSGCVSAYKGYLQSHVKAMSIIRPTILSVEEPLVHPTLRFAGRPDRDLVAFGLRAVMEGKSGPAARSHMIQTALQAILVSVDAKLPPESIARFALYWQANGKFKLEEHTNRRDFDEAFRIIRRCC
jgi:hypothetical protein